MRNIYQTINLTCRGNMSYPYAASSSIDSCTLCYSKELTPDGSSLSFHEFSLIIKDLHSYKVKGFEENPEGEQMIVHLCYNASMKNVRQRLGNLPVTVRKINPFIRPEEIRTVETLRRRFKFGNITEEEEPETPKPAKKRCYKKMPQPDVQI